MSFKDQELECVQCKKEFTFTAGEQEFFSDKGFTEPRRCKSCRNARRKRSQKEGNGIYRSPAFEKSAPAHQKIRGQRGRGKGRPDNRGGGRKGDYRSNGFGGGGAGRGEYRSPAFREQSAIKPEQEYRSPGFKEYDSIKPEEEYRSPGFREYADMNVDDEYRSPAYRDSKKKYMDEKPMFSIICSSCGIEAMVPFMPEEKEEPMCKECFLAVRKAEKEAQDAVEFEDTGETPQPEQTVLTNEEQDDKEETPGPGS